MIFHNLYEIVLTNFLTNSNMLMSTSDKKSEDHFTPLNAKQSSQEHTQKTSWPKLT